MIVLDTNILLRYLLNDDPAQAERATRLLETAPAVTVPPSVVLELVWVLECSDCSREEIVGALRHVLGLAKMRLTHESGLFRAVQWYEGGMDFGDAMHLALSSPTDSLATFDRDFVGKAKRLEAFPAVTLCPARFPAR